MAEPQPTSVKFITMPLKIMIASNIPGKEETPFAFTSSMVYHPSLKMGKKISQYPNLCTNYVYPSTQLNALPFDQRIEFFFDKTFFGNQMKKWFQRGYLTETITEKNDIDSGPAKKWNQKIYKNVSKMLELLFPTVYPVPGNVYDSYSTFFNPEYSEKMGGKTFSFKAILPTFLTSSLGMTVPTLASYYSYVKLDGSVYTVTRAVWLNDLLNHPIYNDLLEKFNIFEVWRKNEAGKITKLIEKNSEGLKRASLSSEYIAFFEDTLPDQIEGQLQNYKPTVLKYGELMNSLETCKKIVEKAKDINTDLEKDKMDIKKIINDTTDLNEFLKNLASNTVISSKFQKEFKVFQDMVKIIENYQVIQQVFFGKNINLNFEKQDGDVVTLFKDKYNKYVEFANSIKEFMEARKNTNFDLYSLFDDYVQRRNQHLQFYFDSLKSVSNNPNWEVLQKNVEAKIEGTKQDEIDIEKEKMNLEMSKMETDKKNLEAEKKKLESEKEKLEAKKENLETEKKNLETEKEKLETEEKLEAEIIPSDRVITRSQTRSNMKNIINKINEINENTEKITNNKENIDKNSNKSNKNVKDIDLIDKKIIFLRSQISKSIPKQTINHIPNIKDIVNCNLDLVEKETIYEIYVNLSCIGGELNSSNRGAVKCEDESARLDKMYHNLNIWKNNTTNPLRVQTDEFFTLALPEAAPVAAAPAEEQKEKKGGKTVRRHRRRKHLTRKCRW